MILTKFPFAPHSRRAGKPKALEKSLVLSAYYVAPKFGTFGSEAGCRQFGCPFLQGDETDAPQVRSKVWNRSPHQQDFAVQRRDEAGHRHALERCDLLEDFPKHLF